MVKPCKNKVFQQNFPRNQPNCHVFQDLGCPGTWHGTGLTKARWLGLFQSRVALGMEETMEVMGGFFLGI
jgi:hypothetical protein